MLAAQVVKVYPVLHGDGYEWGWSFWVALGTILLALATAYLARKTRTVANETKQLAVETTELAKRTSEDVEAQFRPILVPYRDATQGPLSVLNTGLVVLRIANRGNGPALSVEASLRPDGVAAAPWDNGVLPPGEFDELKFERSDMQVFPAIIAMSYEDLSGEPAETVITINLSGDRYRVVNVSFPRVRA